MCTRAAWWLNGKECAGSSGDLGSSLGLEDPLEKGMAPILVFLPGEFPRQRNLASDGPRCPEESDMTKQLTLSLCFQMCT